MTFHARLTELLDAIKNEKDPIKRFAYVQQMDALLVNKAEALRDLVVAAETTLATLPHMGGNEMSAHNLAMALSEALAKLEEA